MFHYCLHIIPDLSLVFREQDGENSSLDHMTLLATLSPKDPEFNTNDCDGEAI